MEALLSEIENSDSLSFDKSFEIAHKASILIKEDAPSARKLIINALNNLSKFHKSSIEIWTDLIESAGFYPYIQKNSQSILFKNLSGELRHGLHKSKFLDKHFHEEQSKILSFLNEDKNVIVSAPTSFGKSLLIEEVVASRKYKNIVIIQPTLALLDETRKKLLKYREWYKLIIRTSQEPSEDLGNIFLFTAERVNEYQTFPPIDFLVIDEFYKLSGNRDDERSSSLNNAFYHILKSFSPKFYLLGPNIDDISDGFIKKYNAVFFKSEYSLVDSRTVNLFEDYKDKFGTRGAKKAFKEEVLFKLLLDLQEEQTIIYCSSPGRARYLAKSFAAFLTESGSPRSEINYPLVEWIFTYVSDTWCLLQFLDFDIGLHDGALQKHISTSIIDYFNQGKIKYLFCTSTIIEGVNTSAKNIIYFDPKKGGNNVDYFDYSNIKGRAGRLMEHYVGKIYNFNKPPADERIVIDIPFFQQDPIKDEVLIQIDEKEVRNKNTDQYRKLSELPTEEKRIIKNNGVRVDGQKSIFDFLYEHIEQNHHLTHWNMPNYKQLEYILGLAWDHLIVPGETTRPMTKKKLVKLTFDYGINQNINYLIQNNFTYNRSLTRNNGITDTDLLDNSIQETFQIMKHWFEYKVPKWLSVMNEIQRYICSQKGLRAGNYIFYANLIENDFLPNNLSILAEYGIPSSAIRKLEGMIPSNIDQDAVLGFIKQRAFFEEPIFLEYEQRKIKENLY